MIHDLQPDRELREVFFITYCIIAFWFYFFFFQNWMPDKAHSISPSLHFSITHTLPGSFVRLLPPQHSLTATLPLSFTLCL